MFSSRVPSDLTPNRFSVLLAEARRRGRPLIDLTESNPTRAGFEYPRDLLAPLADPRGLVYAPHPLGLPAAREAVADDFRRRGTLVDPSNIVLTASTSEAYSLLFKVLCDPGDAVLVPRPSYPLFEHLTRLDSVTPVAYDLEYHGGWSIDLAGVERAITPRTRAVLMVNPNNPTGNMVTAAELDRLASLCRSSGAALISDEVFIDYPLEGAPAPTGTLIGRDDVLGFTLGGLSKTIGLPQAKLGWMAISGPGLDAARGRLELAADTYLSVSTPVQWAAAELFVRGGGVRTQIAARVAANYRALRRHARSSPSCSVLTSHAGWYGVLRVPSLMPEEELVASLLQDDDVVVHPGYFFDFPQESYLIVSLLVDERTFTAGLDRILRRFDRGTVS